MFIKSAIFVMAADSRHYQRTLILLIRRMHGQSISYGIGLRRCVIAVLGGNIMDKFGRHPINETIVDVVYFNGTNVQITKYYEEFFVYAYCKSCQSVYCRLHTNDYNEAYAKAVFLSMHKKNDKCASCKNFEFFKRLAKAK